jgi:hypothetical protein
LLRTRLGKGGPGGGIQGLLHQAVVLMYLGRLQEADRLLAQVQTNVPHHPELRAYRAATRMLAGDFTGQVWPDVRRVYRGQLKKYPQPLWDGSPQPDQTLLVWDSLSGYGDTFQLGRLLGPAKRQFQGRVVFGVPAGTSRLLRSLEGPDTLIEPLFAQVPFDVHCPLDWLPAVDGCAWGGSTVGLAPYLHPEAALVDTWRPMFADRSRIHVGIHWRANPSHFSGRYRAIPLATFAPLLSVPDATFYSLQFDGQDEFAGFPHVRDLGNVDARDARFLQTAAIMSCLDVMIAVDSGPGHLAGSLAVPTWLLLDFSNDPRWCLVGERTPFYPAHRLFRATTIGDFAGVMAVVADELQDAIASGHRTFAR